MASRESLGAAALRQGEVAGKRQWPRSKSKDRASASGHAEGPVGPLSEINPWADEALLKVQDLQTNTLESLWGILASTYRPVRLDVSLVLMGA